MKQLVVAVLVGVAVATAGLVAEGVFAKPVHQLGIVSAPQPTAASQGVHVLEPIIVNKGE
jgi:ABC-type Fe3+-siderophore transport system permease subunit